MTLINISEFILWKKDGSDHYTGIAKYFGLKEYKCIIRKIGDSHVVLIEVDGKWKNVGKFYPYRKPKRIRLREEYKCVGEIYALGHIYHLLDLDNRFWGI